MAEGLDVGDRSCIGCTVIIRVHYFWSRTIYHARIKHIDIRYHQIKELVEEDKVKLVKIYIKENPTNTLTKTLPRDSFHKYVVLMGLMDKSNFIVVYNIKVEIVGSNVMLSSL